MSVNSSILKGARVIAKPIMNNLPLMVVWVIALAIGAVSDLPKLWQLEYPTLTYVLGLLRIMTCSVALSVVVAYLLAAVARWAPLRWLLALIALLIIGIYVFLRLNYSSRLTPEISVFISETNRGEATEFLNTYLLSSHALPVLIGVVIAMVCWVLVDRWWQRRQCGTSKRVDIGLSGVMALALIGAACAPTTWTLALSLLRGDKAQYNDSFGLDAITNVMFCQHQLRQYDELTARSIEVTNAACDTAISMPTDAPTVVLVIGESYIKTHASIYGYKLPTTPCMAQELAARRLYAFTDAVSPFNNTNMTMRTMLSLNSVAAGEEWQDMPLFPALFKKAGYRVDMWDNQREFFRESAYTRGLNGFIYHPEVIRLCYNEVNTNNFDYDGPFVDNYAAHAAKFGDSVPSLVIIHLRGQHIRADKRYPHNAGFDRFSPSDYAYRTEAFLTDAMRQEIAYYDNATFYNDYVMGKIFDIFSKSDAVVVYFSDHGDEIYDYRPSIGRRTDGDKEGMMLHYQHDVPFVVWCSPTFQNRHPDKIQQIAAAVSRPVMLDNVGQMLLGLAGINAACYHPDRDALNAAYIPRPRIVNFNIPYDNNSSPSN